MKYVICVWCSWRDNVSSWFPWRPQWNSVCRSCLRQSEAARSDDTRMPC